MTLKAYLRACERQFVQVVLDECQGDKDAAAKKLGVSLATFYRKYGGQ
jgi:transcriptional regulator with PAS, ATPase and Fis domain